MTKNIEICKAEEVGAQVLDIRTTAERQTVAAINAAFGLAIPLPANEPGEITELPAAVSAHDRQLLAQTLGKPEPAATLSTTDPLATFVATLTRELYRHFAARTADYLPADFPDPFARNIAHLLQAVQSLSPRKISNGSATNDGLPDGISLVNTLCGGYADVVELKDDNTDWTWTRENFAATLAAIFPNAKKWTLGCRLLTKALAQSNSTVEHLIMSDLRTMQNRNTYIAYYWSALKKLEMPAFEGMNYAGDINYVIATHCDNLEEVIAPNWVNGGGDNDLVPCTFGYNAKLRRVQLGKIHDLGGMSQWFYQCPLLEDVEFADGVQWNTNLSNWNPTDKGTTFLQNFRDHIALRLTDQGSGLTLTLSQAVRNAIHAAESTYGIEDIIVNQKHWTLSPAPSA